MTKLLVSVMVTCSWTALAYGNVVKWTQLPDLTTNGIDILSYGSGPVGVADDFKCTATGLITDFHIWGSWLGDQVSQDPWFGLVVLSDVPAQQGVPSHPGDLLWMQIGIVPSSSQPYATVPDGEWFWDPRGQPVPNGDTQVWQYDFLIPDASAFQQTQDTIYWLCVVSGNPGFGWKTRDPQDGHFNDDAAWSTFIGGPWNELHYPIGHPYEGQSIDMAFELTTTAIPVPGAVVLGMIGVGCIGRWRFRRDGTRR
jgi:hypothetical protein